MFTTLSRRITTELFPAGIPVLGICYGAQLMALVWADGSPQRRSVSMERRVDVDISGSLALFGVSEQTVCWMSHTDYIAKAPEGFRITACTPVCPVAAMEDDDASCCGAVPSGGHAYRRGKEDALRFCYGRLRLQRRLANGRFRRHGPSMRSARRSAEERRSALCPAASIPRWLRS